jgi:hypothetical protein
VLVHFDPSISLGQLLVAASFVGSAVILYGKLAIKLEQHDLMWVDYERRHGLRGPQEPCAAHWHRRAADEEKVTEETKDFWRD